MKFEEQYKVLDDLFRFQDDNLICQEVNISYQDFKDYFLRNNLWHLIKIKVSIYNKPKLDNNFYDLNMRTDDDEFLNNFEIVEICGNLDSIYLDFGDYERNQDKIFGPNTLSFIRDITEDLEVDMSDWELDLF